MRWITSLTCMSLLTVSYSLSQTTPAASPTTPTAKSYLREATISESAGTVHVVANSPRPLAQTLEALQQKYGWVAGYEDPQFISKLDLAATADSGDGVPKSPPPTRLPAGGLFNVDFPASAPDEAKTLQQVVDAYNRSDNPGRFELRTNKQGAFFVVGTQARDARGQVSRQRAVLDAPVTLVAQERNATDTVNLICKKLAVSRGIKITLGVFPRTLMAASMATVGGTRVSARDLLFQTLTATHHTLYWQLLFDPASKGYFLNIHSVKAS
jgi:hypothetical protein